MHVLATLPGPVLPHQQYARVMEHDLLAEPLRFNEGSLDVPTKPGIGVDLDREAILNKVRASLEDARQMQAYDIMICGNVDEFAANDDRQFIPGQAF
jgi:L-alanine-DL-glutamate epimerase-like enolase superfamily enzyme